MSILTFLYSKSMYSTYTLDRLIMYVNLFVADNSNFHNLKVMKPDTETGSVTTTIQPCYFEQEKERQKFSSTVTEFVFNCVDLFAYLPLPLRVFFFFSLN